MAPRVLFAKQHIYDFVEAQQTRLQRAYEGLSDEDAMDDVVVQKIKAQFALQIPVLRRDQMDYEENQTRLSPNETSGRTIFGGPGQASRVVTDYVVHVPFEGDPKVFDLAPSAYNGTVAEGEVNGNEVLLRFRIGSTNLDLQAMIERELGKIEWRLHNLMGSTAHLELQLNNTLAVCRAARKRDIDTRASSAVKLSIPKRPPAPNPVQTPPPQTSLKPEQTTKPTRNKGEQWDVFISHASEDKESYVDGLVNALIDAGISVWYDRLVLEWGDDLRKKIDHGLKNCLFGVVVLSKAFLGGKKWTDHEFSTLFELEEPSKKLILPIWHGIVREDLLTYSPSLAGRLAKISTNDSYQDIADSLLRMLGRPVPSRTAASVSSPAAADARRGETVGYAWYEGSDGQRVQLYVRKSASTLERFTFEDNRGEQLEGSLADIAIKYALADKGLTMGGFKRTTVFGGSYPEFNL